MNKEFVPYQEALALKELGFDEPCLFLYNSSHDEPKTFLANPAYARDWNTLYVHITNKHLMSAPTYSQAFRWFRDKHDLRSWIESFDKTNYKAIILNHYGSTFNSHEEAELECLKKLIEIVKNK
jgi:hypothetical protein